jgi:Fic family protein
LTKVLYNIFCSSKLLYKHTINIFIRETIMKPYIPETLPLNTSLWNWEKLTLKVSSASASLAYYNGILESMINPEIFISPLETEEAVFSSIIEGTVTTIDEILNYEVDLKPENSSKRDDIIEVINYRKAMHNAKDWLQRELTFNSTMICAIQNDLMAGVRGKDKSPGKIRKEQVWIGPKYSEIDEASFVPPEPLGIDIWLDNLMDFLKSDDTEPLIQTAIMHAQFEIIHPFMDGNGRTGRILIPLFLWHKKRLNSPMFYISKYFEEYREEYNGNLLYISQKKDWQQWISFFLDAVTFQAKRNAEKATNILLLYNEMKNLVTSVSNSPNGIKILDTIFSKPIFRTSDFIKMSGLNHQTSYRIIVRLKEQGILSTYKKPAGRAPEVFRFDKLHQLLNS